MWLQVLLLSKRSKQSFIMTYYRLTERRKLFDSTVLPPVGVVNCCVRGTHHGYLVNRSAIHKSASESQSVTLTWTGSQGEK